MFFNNMNGVLVKYEIYDYFSRKIKFLLTKILFIFSGYRITSFHFPILNGIHAPRCTPIFLPLLYLDKSTSCDDALLVLITAISGLEN